jgi:hypothetical protein
MQGNQQTQRDQIIHQALFARTAEEVEQAIRALNHWCEAHPEDDSVRDAYEPLILRQSMFTASPQELALN